MRRRVVALTFIYFCVGQSAVRAQDLGLFGREIEVHGFVSQGFVYTNHNNWLTMSSSQGSAALRISV